VRRILRLFRSGQTPTGSSIPPVLSFLVLLWLVLLPLSIGISLHLHNFYVIDVHTLLFGTALIHDWQTSWRWRDGWHCGRYEVVAEILDAWEQNMDPREWIMREMYFGDPKNPYLRELSEPDDPPFAETL
jgi:hypothetical protein